MLEKRKTFHQGPYLSAAFLCERILTEQDGVKSAIRIIDRITHRVVGPALPPGMQPFDYQLSLFIRLKSGAARGTHQLRIVLVKPSGESSPPLDQPVLLEGEEDRGVDIVAHMVIRFTEEGLYWFELYLNQEDLLTRIPLRIIYMPQSTQQMGKEQGGHPPQDRGPLSLP